MLAVLASDRPAAGILAEESGSHAGGNGGSRVRLVDLNFDPPLPSAPGFQAATLAGDPRFLAAFKPRVVSTSLALAWVATGRRAAYVTDGVPRDSVHFGAGTAICEAAGRVVTDLFGDAWGRGPTGLLAAADAETHERLLGLTRAPLQ